MVNRSIRPDRSRGDVRGQGHTLEGLIAGLIVLASIGFALQVTAVTPLSASTSSEHIQNQQRAGAAGVLAIASDSGALERATLYFNESKSRFHDEPGIRQTEFGQLLQETFARQGIAYNVYIIHVKNGSREEEKRSIVDQGTPSESAVRITRPVVLMDDDRLRDANNQPTDTTVSEADQFYADDVSKGGLYNVLRVEVIVWRI